MPTYEGPYYSDNVQPYYWDNIMCQWVWTVAYLDPVKRSCFENFGAKYENMQHDLAVQDVYGDLPTVFLLTSGSPETLTQVARTCSSFERLGFQVVLAQDLQKDFGLAKH